MTDKEEAATTPTNNGGETEASQSTAPIVSATKKTRPPYKYDPNKITLRFLFANRDGLTVTVECTPSDTVGEVKGALLSVWPEGRETGKKNSRCVYCYVVCLKWKSVFWSSYFLTYSFCFLFFFSFFKIVTPNTIRSSKLLGW